MIPNTHPTTGIRYTVYAMRNLDPDVYRGLWYGPDAIDVTYEEMYKEALSEALKRAKHKSELIDEEFDEADFVANWECPDIAIDEHNISGTYEGVRYEISHLGGAELLWVLESPHIGQFVLCSPCCPGACDGDSPIAGGFSGYAVPEEWLSKE